MRYSFDDLVAKVEQVLIEAGCSCEMANSTARALVSAEAQGLKSHGVIRTNQYAGHVRHGRADGQAEPVILRERGGTVLVDACEGLAFPACDFAVSEAIRRARTYGIGLVGVTRSHHFGPAAIHLEAIARADMVGLALTNSPAAMPAQGGKRAVFGTNPIALAFPRQSADPIMIDLSLSAVARGRLMVAAREGREIPGGWAMDKQGNSTNDPKLGLKGMMCPLGGSKGAVLALAVELLCTSLTGASLAFEADSFFKSTGNRPHIGHVFMAIDPDAMAGLSVYYERLETLVAAMLTDPDVRLPGARRLDVMRQSLVEGIEVADSMLVS